MSNKTIKALIVEDVFLIQRLLENILGPYAKCLGVANGTDAINTYTSHYFNGEPFDLVCLDIFLPGMDGIEVLQSIRDFEDEINIDANERTKIVMVSSMANHNMIKKAHQIGCNGYITKPFSKDEILNTLLTLGLIHSF
ncbi:MAG: response regulator [Calditrichae bacterium]|nr:response regulator [Calditrichota bacterium]MCB9059233.1 response regulator [Calditrichia bacterium]